MNINRSIDLYLKLNISFLCIQMFILPVAIKCMEALMESIKDSVKVWHIFLLPLVLMFAPILLFYVMAFAVLGNETFQNITEKVFKAIGNFLSKPIINKKR